MVCGALRAVPAAPSPTRPPQGDPTGRQRVLEAAREQELWRRRDLAPRISPAAPPPCKPSLGPPAKPRPECPVAQAALCEHKPDGERRAGRGEDKAKKVRFSDQALPEDDKEDGAEEDAAARGRCTRVDVPTLGPSRPTCEREDAAPAEPHDCAAHRERRQDQGRPGKFHKAPCDCPCWAAYNPQPPDTLATGDIYRTCRLPKRFQYPVWFSGYNSYPSHPLYRTTASDIGRFPPSVHTVPTIYRPIDRSMSKVLVPVGPWRNRSLCTTGSIFDIYTYNNFN